MKFVFSFVLALMVFVTVPGCAVHNAEGACEETAAQEMERSRKVIAELSGRRIVTVFGSARIKSGPIYNDAVKLGELLAKKNLAVMTGGGPGIMEAANRGAVKGGGYSIGIKVFLPGEPASEFLSYRQDFRYFAPRKNCMMQGANAFVICPGGMGTLDELFEIVTLIQTGTRPNAPIVLLGRDYWQGLADWVRNTVCAKGMISDKDLDLLHVVDTPEEAVEYICASLNATGTGKR